MNANGATVEELLAACRGLDRLRLGANHASHVEQV